MALSDGIVGARHTAQQITWKDETGTAVDLTGATITGFKRVNEDRTTVAIDGSLDLVDLGANGVFTWAYGAVDVGTAGNFEVQFVATYGDSTKDKTFVTDWKVHEALSTS
jgi:hypothetical protein